jgi:hypothetical protein
MTVIIGLDRGGKKSAIGISIGRGGIRGGVDGTDRGDDRIRRGA